MPSGQCATPAQRPPMRECIDGITDMLDKSNDILEAIEDKLFGLNQNESCDKACPPQNIQDGIDRMGNVASRLLGRLDSINNRL